MRSIDGTAFPSRGWISRRPEPREHRPRMFGRGAVDRWLLAWTCLCTLSVGLSARPAHADSASDLFANIDEATVEQAVEWVRDEARGPAPEEVRRLVWHVGRLTPSTLQSRASTRPLPADEADFAVVTLTGTATRAEAFPISGEAADYLDMDRLWIVQVQSSAADAPVLVLCRDAPLQWMADRPLTQPLDEPVRCTAVVLNASEQPVVVAQRVEWYPDVAHTGSIASPAELLLGGAGFDVGRLPEIQRRSSLSLEREPAQDFYGLFGAVTAIDREAFEAVASRVRPIELLSGQHSQTGAFVSTIVETRRITRVAVTDAAARQLLGQDHYWQVDAFGDLDRVKVQLDTGTGELVDFENRYPISILTTELSDELRAAVEQTRGAPADVAMLNRPIRIFGASYRLWSYESDYVDARGGGRQVAPLVIAAWITDVAPSGAVQANLDRLGMLVAAVVIGSILLIAGLLLWTSRRDRAAADRLRRTQAGPDLSQLHD